MAGERSRRGYTKPCSSAHWVSKQEPHECCPVSCSQKTISVNGSCEDFEQAARNSNWECQLIAKKLLELANAQEFKVIECSNK
jgi:hypothetical protein